MKKSGPLLAGTAVALACLSAIPVVHAQMMFDRAPASLTVEGFVNLTAGRSGGEDGGDAGGDSRADAGLRLLALYRPQPGNAFGARVEALSSPEDNLEAGERSVLVFAGWGRVELGKRQGLPVTITGYAPSNFTFTGSEFSVSSGLVLDPGGTLATSFLTRGVASRIDAISSLGFSTTLFGDRSGKLIYLAPKTHGWQFATSYSPDAEEQQDRYKDLALAGLTHEVYSGRNVYKFGGAVAHARGGRVPGNNETQGDLTSYSAGMTATLVDALTLGAGFTYDGDSGLASGPQPQFRSSAYGTTVSANYNTGPWTIGGYAQCARSEGDSAQPGTDRLRVTQLGVSYRTSTKVRLYAASYFYLFNDESGAAGRFDGTVLLGGVRLTL